MQGCQYEIVYAERDSRMKSRLCNHPIASGIYCAMHCYVNEIMKLAKELDYPKFVAVYLRNRDGQLEAVLTIGSGYENWQAYADRHTLKHHDDLIRRLKDAIRNASREAVQRQEAA
jgi:hypothetical protein